MLEHELWLRPGADLAYEVDQAYREGRDRPEELLQQADRAALLQGEARDIAALAIYEAVQTLPLRQDYPYGEPDALGGILASRPPHPPLNGVVPAGEDLLDRLYGGWLGRCAGCLLGQPVEGWYRPRIVGYLKDTQNLPIDHYLASDIGPQLREKYQVNDDAGPYDADCKNWINNVTCMPEDDDTNYTILGLKLLERRGMDFTSEDVANFWL
ncbi:MAG: ADP-ribosylglycohydrolase family protein, partial [Pseudoflavonifractor sp.]